MLSEVCDGGYQLLDTDSRLEDADLIQTPVRGVIKHFRGMQSRERGSRGGDAVITWPEHI